MSGRSSWSALLCVALCVNRIHAADDAWFPSEPSQPVDRCVQAALRNDPEVAISESEARAAALYGADEDAWKNPELRLGKPFPADGDGDAIQASFRVFPPRPGESADAALVASAQAAQELAKVELDRFELALRVRQAYVDACLAERKIAVRQDALTAAKERLAALDQRVAAGGADKLERAVAAARVIEMAEETDAARSDFNVVLAELNYLCGEPAGALVAPNVGLPDQDLAGLQAIARARRVELAMAKQAAREAAGNSRIADRAAWPWFTFAEASCDVTDDHERDYSFLVGIELPLFDRQTGLRAGEKSRAADTQRLIDVVARRIDREVAEAYARLHARESAAQKQDADVQATMRELDGMTQALRGQGGDALDSASVMDARARLVLRAEERISDLILARLELHHALGLRGLDDIPGQ